MLCIVASLGAVFRSRIRESVSSAAAARQDSFSLHSDCNRSPPTALWSAWKDVMEESEAVSRACPHFIMYTVSVITPNGEARHQIGGSKPNLEQRGCAVLLLLQLLEQSKSGKCQKSLGSTVLDERSRELSRLGWTVMSSSTCVPGAYTRRASRLPKLVPHKFFPHTEKVLYSDLKLLSAIKSFEASLLAETLLRDTSFGIIQHPQSSGISWEHDEILKVWKKRPKVVDSAEKLNLQVQLIKGVLSPLQERSFAVEGQLHARQLRGQEMPQR